MDHLTRMLSGHAPIDEKVSRLLVWLDISREKMSKHSFEKLSEWLCSHLTPCPEEKAIFEVVEKLLCKEGSQPLNMWIIIFEGTHKKWHENRQLVEMQRGYITYLKLLRTFLNFPGLDQSSSDFMSRMCEFALGNLEVPCINEGSPLFPKFVACNVNVISSIVVKVGDSIPQLVQRILSCLKFYLFVGVTQLKYPVNLLYSSGVTIDFDTDKRSAGQRLALSKRKQNTPKKQKTLEVGIEKIDHSESGTTSDSELSENDGKAVKNILADTRLAVARCLVNAFRCVPYASTVPYWPHFLAEESAALERPKLTRSLVWVAGRDPDFRVRTAAFHILSLILLKGATVWKTADYFAVKSFTTFAATLASYAVTMQKYGLQFVRTERANNTRVAGIKCMTDFLSVMPHKKLPKETTVDILIVASKFLEHECMDTRVTALVLFKTALTIEDLDVDSVLIDVPSVPELQYDSNSQNDSACEETFEVDLDDVESRIALCDFSESVKQSCWLSNYCLALLEKDPKSANITSTCKIECASILGEICRTRFYLVENQLPVIFHTLKKSFASSSDAFVQVRVIKSIGRIFAAVSQRFPHIKVDADKHLDEICLFWVEYIQDVLFRVVGTQTASVEAETVTSLVFIGSEILDMLPSRQKIMCETLLLELSSSEFYQVRSSAVRVLGTWTSYKSMEDEINFFLDSCEAIVRLAADPKCAENAIWALSAITDKFGVFVESGEVPEDLPGKLFLASLTSFEKFKLYRTHSVRALGNSCSLMSEACINRHLESVDRAIDLIRDTVVNGQRDKLRWNACYSAGKVFRNPVLASCAVEKLLPAVLTVLETSKNFKIRIQAASSLLNIPSWRAFGTLWATSWKFLLLSSSAGTEFCPTNELVQLNNFLKTVLTVLKHLISLIDCELALVGISGVLLDYTDAALIGLNRVPKGNKLPLGNLLDYENRHQDLIECLKKICCE